MLTGADEILKEAIAVLRKQDEMLLPFLDDILAPLYVTDAEGIVTYFNKSCIAFTGRNPVAGKDRWCVTWKLYTDKGEFLPHDQCPMADAVRAMCEIRGVTAVAERPDGTRVQFMPFPTPLFSKSGEFLGAINLLIDITEKQQPGDLRNHAERCRRLAGGCSDHGVATSLNRMATQYEIKASALDLMPQ
jgi:PAS domain-containing protein